MMQSKSYLFAASAFALLSLAACGSGENAADTETTATTTETVPADETATAATGTDTAAPATGAEAFVNNAAISDMFEIQSSQLALQKATSQQIKDFAQMMIKEHTATSNQLKTVLSNAGLQITPPTTLDQARQDLLSELQNASAQDFDTRYADIQTMAHEQTLALMQGYASTGDNEQLRQFASETAPKIQMHLEKIRSLDEAGADDAAAK